MVGTYQKGLCIAWAVAIYSSAYAFTTKPQIYAPFQSFFAQTRSHALFAYRWMDYLIWFACRGFHLFSFAVLSLLLINTFKVFRTWPTLVFIPLSFFALFEDSHRLKLLLQFNQDSLLLLDLIGIVIGIVYFVRAEIKLAQAHTTNA